MIVWANATHHVDEAGTLNEIHIGDDDNNELEHD